MAAIDQVLSEEEFGEEEEEYSDLFYSSDELREEGEEGEEDDLGDEMDGGGEGLGGLPPGYAGNASRATTGTSVY